MLKKKKLYIYAITDFLVVVALHLKAVHLLAQYNLKNTHWYNFLTFYHLKDLNNIDKNLICKLSSIAVRIKRRFAPRLLGTVLSWIMNRLFWSVSIYRLFSTWYKACKLKQKLKVRSCDSNPTLKSGAGLDCSVELAFRHTERILRKRPGVEPCWMTPSTFSVSCCVFCTGIGSLGVRGDGDRASCVSKTEREVAICKADAAFKLRPKGEDRTGNYVVFTSLCDCRFNKPVSLYADWSEANLCAYSIIYLKIKIRVTLVVFIMLWAAVLLN